MVSSMNKFKTYKFNKIKRKKKRVRKRKIQNKVIII